MENFVPAVFGGEVKEFTLTNNQEILISYMTMVHKSLNLITITTGRIGTGTILINFY